MYTNLENLKQNMGDFRNITENIDLSLWTPEKFSEVNALLTMMEEDIMETEKETAELMSGLKEFKEILVQFRKKYFEKRL